MSDILFEAKETLYHVALWLLHNNYVLQIYSHAATLV